MSHVRPVSTWLGKRLKLRNVRVPLTSHAHIRVAPGESTSNPKSGHALGSASSVSTGFGLPVKPSYEDWALAGQSWASQETMSSWPWLGLETTGDPTSTHTLQM